MRFPRLTLTRHRALDATGLGLSALCVVHCLAFPAAAVAAPMLAPEVGEMFGGGETAHLILLALAAPVSLLALGWSVRSTRGGWPLFLTGLAGLVLMGLGVSHIGGELGETLLTLAGVSVLAAAHLINWRRRAAAGHDHERDCGLCDHAHTH